MKRNWTELRGIAAFIGLLALPSLVGCKTTTTVTTDPNTGATSTNTATVFDPDRAKLAAKTITATGATIAINYDKNSTGYFSAVATVFELAANTGTYNPTNIASSIEQMTVNELKTVEVKSAIAAVLAIYQACWADAVSQKADKVVWLKPILVGIAEGFRQATATTK